MFGSEALSALQRIIIPASDLSLVARFSLRSRETSIVNRNEAKRGAFHGLGALLSLP